MALTGDEAHLARLYRALEAARRDAAWVVVMPLPDVIDELRRWLADDRQWHHARAASWKSLLVDLRRSVAAHPAAFLEHAGDPAELR